MNRVDAFIERISKADADIDSGRPRRYRSRDLGPASTVSKTPNLRRLIRAIRALEIEDTFCGATLIPQLPPIRRRVHSHTVDPPNSRLALWWLKLSALGTDTCHESDFRHISFANQIAFIGLMLTALMTVGFAVYDAVYLSSVILLNAMIGIMQGAVLILHGQGRRSGAQFLVLAAPCLQFFLLTFYFGRDSGAHLPLFVIGMLTFLVVQRDQHYILLYSLIMTAMMFLRAHFSFTPDVARSPLDSSATESLYIMFSLLTFAMIAGFTFMYYLEIKRAEHLLKSQVRQSESLLLNILPKPIAERLKCDHRSIAEAFMDVTVLLADIVGFTQHSAKFQPSQLVDLLNEVFSRFDKLVDEYGL